MKTILCANYQKEYIYEDLAKYNHGVVKDVLAVPLSVALGEKHTDKHAALLKISHTLKKRSDAFPIYQKMFDYPAFIQEIFQFVLECIQGNIQVDSLPETNEQEKELKEIIRILLEIPFVEKENVVNKEIAIEKLRQDDVEVYPFFESDPYYVEILEQLKDKIKPTDIITSQKHLRYALSTRREIEAIAQDIATYRRPCNLVLTSWKTQYPVVQQVFARYEIPFSTVHHDVSARLIQRYVSLVNLAYQKNKEALMKALYIDAFGVDDQKKSSSLFTVLKYLDQVLVDVECPKHLSQSLKESEVFKKEATRYAYFEERADELFNHIQQDVDSLIQASTFEEILMNAFEIIRNQKILQNKHELKEGRQLRNVLQSILTSEKQTVENIPFVMHMLQGIHSDSAVFTDAICTVTDLTHPVKKQEVTYVIGCSGKNYPSFPVHNGLFDEDYLAKIPSYPSMNQRYGYYMNALSWIDTSAEEIYYSYSTNDYQGKEMQLAYEVQSKVDMKEENTPWPILIVDNHVDIKHELTPETAHQLFLDNKGQLNGSVSTVESYYRNPYGYFIQKGLGIMDQEFSGLDPITIGNIQHHFMYTLLTSYKDSSKRKQYALQEDGENILTSNEIKELLRPYFDILKLTHPNEQYLYDISLERLADSLSKFMTFMHDLEKDSSFIPEYFEYRLPETMIGNVNIRGIIDRIDLYQDLIRIIDYKSSVLSISEDEVKQGLRLQMLTYMMIVANNLQGKKYNPTAVQYISMKDETIDLNRVYNKCGDMPKHALLNSLEEDFIKSRKCAVWIFNEHRDDVDIDARHIKSPKNIYDFDKIQAYIEGIYANFHKQVLNGNIGLSPIENTTLPYMAMYHFDGEYRIPTAVEVEGIPTDIPFKLDKEEIAAKGQKKMRISEKNQLSAEQSVACNSSGMGIVVSASAGAGKTKVLVSRLVKRCIEDNPRVPLSRILALTFTEAAASEMKKRVAQELNEIKQLAEKEDNVNQELIQYIDDQIIALASANITTIDSFCLSIIKKYYNIIGLDPATTENILSSGQNENIQRDAFMRALEYAYQTSPQETVALASYFSSRADDYDGLYDAVVKINRHAESSVDPDEWYQHALKMYPKKFDPTSSNNFTSFDAFDINIRKYFFASLYGQLAVLQRDIEILQELPEAINGRGKVIDNSVAFDTFLNIIQTLQAELMPEDESSAYTFEIYQNYKQQIQMMDDTKLSSYKKENYPEHARAMDHLKKTLKNMTEERLNEDDFVSDARDASIINTALINLAKNTYQNCVRIKQENTAMYFSDMERYAYEILKHENVAKVIRENLQEVMIDEFQDTSKLQDTIIEMIASPNCIFRVGDTKQSIYRFRQAKPALMRSKLNESEKIVEETIDSSMQSAKIILSRNYRSDARIIQFTNILFQKIMNVKESTEKYGEDDIVDWFPKNDSPDALIEFASYTPKNKTAIVSDDEDEDEDIKMIKANWIANKIIDTYNQELELAKKSDTKLPSFHDFAILLRSHGDKAYLKAAFEAKGIPYSIDTREGFYRSELCQTVIALCTAMLDEEADSALFACMVSNLYNYSDEVIAKAKIRLGSIKAVAKEFGIYDDLQMYKEIADTYGIPRMLSELANHNTYFNRLNISQQSNFDYLFEMTVSAKYNSVAEFLNALKAVEDEVSNEAVSKGSADDIVTVTTIHHSKGLQYKYVFLWSNATNQFRDSAEVVNVDDELYLGLNFLCTNPYRAKRKTIHKRAIEYKANLEDAEEFIRILYVAVTRAVRRLYIVDALPKPIPYRGKKFMLGDLLIRNGMSGLILSTMANEPIMKQVDIDPSWNVFLEHKETETVTKLPHYGYTSVEEKEVLTPSSTEFGNILPALDLTETNAGREYGTRIHACFEQLPPRLFNKEDLVFLNLTSTERKHLLAFGDSEIYHQAVEGEIHHEYPFYVQTEKEKIHGIMDFVSILDDKIILIDFKTDNTELSKIKLLYTEQINTYRRALQLIYPDKTIDAYAWSVHHDQAIEIE